MAKEAPTERLNTEEEFKTPQRCVNCGQGHRPLERSKHKLLADLRLSCPICGHEWGMDEEASPSRQPYQDRVSDHRELIDFPSPVEM